MNLNIILNSNTNHVQFIRNVHDSIHKGFDKVESEIKKWEECSFINSNGKIECGFKHCETQFEQNGWITLKSSTLGVQACFKRSNKFATTLEQESIILFRFATMLRNHFSNDVLFISLLGL